MRVLLTGGGTGGHTYPLVAVAREIKRLYPEAALYFLGPTTFGVADLEREGIAVRRLITGKIRRYVALRWVIDVFLIPFGFLHALVKVFSIMPDAVLSKGGYGSVPVVFAAWLLRIPVIIHESDTLMGAANRFGARFARAILTSWPETGAFVRPKDRSKVVLTGNPIRMQQYGSAGVAARELFGLVGGRPLIAVLGGSLGAERLNDLLLLSLPELLKSYEIVQQTGMRNIERVKAAGAALIPADLQAFWHPAAFFSEQEIAALLGSADLVVSRAGAGAICEIAAAGRASILIPLDQGSRGEQKTNAYSYARTGAALVLEEANLTPHLFLKDIGDLLQDAPRQESMKAQASAFARPRAAEDIARIVIEHTQ